MSPRPSIDRRVVELPLAAALITLVPGIAALIAHSVLLFPSLGPTALIQVHSPEHRSARLYNVLVGHSVGLASAFVSVWVFGIAYAPSVFAAHEVSPARVGATLLAIALATGLELLLQAAHPPAASTTLLASLGSFHPTRIDTLQVAVGVLLVGGAGELMRRYLVSRRHSSS